MNKSGEVELRHLAPYSPYGLELLSDRGIVYSVVGFKDDSLLTVPKGMDFGSDTYHTAFYAMKPILRPLSDLIKEIDLGEGLEIPIKNIFHDYRKGLELKMSTNKDGGLNEMWLDYKDGNGDYVNESSVTRDDWNYLYKNLFDVEGLIEKGLAVDINTIKDKINVYND